ncbi:MAG: site-specific DNA-methyltransferase [Candidatus Pacebacteria bacterium]|nr:site-specific DNA-methyltransferase [Candidatus Paceibacterota bacterium]
MEKTMTNEIKKVKDDLIAEIDKRIVDKIIEKTNADLLKKLITNAETINEAIMIAELGTTYKRTGFHFDKRLEKMTDTIKHFKKNEKLSFVQDKNALTHKLIIGDNYDALQNLLIQYRGMIDVIYIDPPYGKDSMGEFAKTNYENAITRDNLLSMLYPRLVLARQLLSDNGVIFCSIDDKNQAYVKGLFDEVFEEGNFACSFPRVTKKGGKSSTAIALNHDYVLSYTCTAKKGLFAQLHDDEGYSNEDEYVATRGRYKLNQTLDYDSLGWVKTLDYPISIDGRVFYAGGDKKAYEKRQSGLHGRADWGWRWSKDLYEFGKEQGFIEVKGDRIYTKTYQNAKIVKIGGKYQVIESARTAPVSTLRLVDNEFSNDNANKDLSAIMGKGIFDYPKPKELIKQLIKLCESSEDVEADLVVLDFFAGSGTTGQAVLEMNKDNQNRQFILVTNNEKTSATPKGIAYDATSKRLKRVMTGECYDGTKDFKWNEKNKPLGDNLDVYDISTVANFEATKDKTPFDVIDETLYGKEKLGVNEKIKWVCENFEGTTKTLEKK